MEFYKPWEIQLTWLPSFRTAVFSSGQWKQRISSVRILTGHCAIGSFVPPVLLQHDGITAIMWRKRNRYNTFYANAASEQTVSVFR